MPDDTPTPAADENHPIGEDATENQVMVFMYLKEEESPTPASIPARPAETCGHLETVCSMCVRWWNRDYAIDFDATAAGRELLALRRALDKG